jgi:hypothetical protein
MTLTQVQRVILENQIVLAELLLMVLRQHGGAGRTLDHVSARIAETRRLLDSNGNDSG